MPRWVKLALAGVAAFFALAIIGLIILVNAIDLKPYAKLAIEQVKVATGRELRISGDMKVKIFPHIAIVAEGVSFGNAPWGARRELATIKRLEAEVALLSLLGGEIDIVRLVAVEPDVLLETDAKGVGNWVFGASTAKPVATEEPSALPLNVTGLAIDRGVFNYHDGITKETLRFTVQQLRLQRHLLAAQTDLELEATFRDQPFTIKGTIGTVKRLLAKDDAWPVQLTLATDGARATIDGTVDWKAKLPGPNIVLKADVSKTAALERLIGTMPPLPTPLALSANLATSAGETNADPIQITLGKNVVQGRAALHTGDPRPFLSAQLKSREIDIPPLAGGSPERKSSSEPVFSDAPLPAKALHSVDADLELTVDRLVLPTKFRAALESLQVRAVLKGGRLEVQPLQATVGGGMVKGRAVFDAGKIQAPTLAINLDGKGISMEKIAAAVGEASALSGGNTDLAFNLTGPGESLRRFASRANGELQIVVGPTRLSGAALDIGGDLLTSILDKADPFRRSDPYTNLKCAVIRLPVRDGIATSQRTIAYETTKMNMVLAGTINLRDESLDLAIRPTVTEGLGVGAASLADLVRVSGTLSKPAVGIDTLKTAETAASVGAAVMTGGLSLLGEAAYKKWTADPHPCQTALKSASPPPEAKKEGGGSSNLFRRLFK